MNIRPASAALAYLVDVEAWESPFYLIDVGASGGIGGTWAAFGDRLRAVGFEPLIAEAQRLNDEESRPHVCYEAALVGVENFDALFPPAERNDPIRSRTNDSFQRVSAARAQEILWRSAGEFYNRGNPAVLSGRRIQLDDYVPTDDYAAVDFVKIDTDGHDIEVLLGADRLLTAGVLGVMVEAQFHGAAHPYANIHANIDHYLRDRGFSLFDLDVNRYSRRALPTRFVYDIPAQTDSGQVLWGDALYLRDLGDPAYDAKHAFSITRDRVTKLAALFALFGLADCLAELFITRLALVPEPLRLAVLDRLPAEVGFGAISYQDHVAAFERDPQSFYPRAVRAGSTAGGGRLTQP